MLVPYTNSVSNPALQALNLSVGGDLHERDAEVQDAAQAVFEEINNRATNLGAGLLYAWRKFFGTESDSSAIKTKSRIDITRSQAKLVKRQGTNETIPFSSIYEKIFPQDTIRVLYIELDPGVDDGAALLQLLAAKKKSSGKKIEIVGIVPCVGNAILTQTVKNTMQFLELTSNRDIPVYSGAVAPLAIENNQTAINAMNQGINATHFYGYDGEEDVGGWPSVTMQPKPTPGYQYAATTIFNASPEAPLTLVSTSALTELAKTLNLVLQLESQNNLPAGSFAKKISAISIMGGCLNPAVGCNAPFNVPDSEKTSEANFYFDSPAAQIVFSICQQYEIPILLAPLDLTQQPGLLWTQNQDDMLNSINNTASVQMSRVASVIPYIDALHFPNKTYPMHDLQAATDIIFPEFYDVIPISAAIGNIGQVIINQTSTDTQKNVYVLSIPVEKQPLFYQTVLKSYKNFSPNPSLKNVNVIVGIAVWGLISVIGVIFGIFVTQKCFKRSENPDEEKALIRPTNS